MISNNPRSGFIRQNLAGAQSYGSFVPASLPPEPLRIAPSVPKEWDKFEIDKDFRGCKLHITVHNPGHVESGFKKMIVNREELGENYIPQEKLTEITEVELFMS